MTIPDICLCKGTGCNRKQSCVRFLAEPKAKNQAWIVEAVAIPVKSECGFFAQTIEEVVSK